MYRIRLMCDNVPNEISAKAADDICHELRSNYPHEHNVECSFVDGKLILVAENNHDAQELNLLDEFSDLITAFVVEEFDGQISIDDIQKI